MLFSNSSSYVSSLQERINIIIQHLFSFAYSFFETILTKINFIKSY